MALAALLGATSAVTVQREPLLTWTPTPADSGHPKDYFVPNFGQDEDMKAVPHSIAAAEIITGHKFIPDSEVVGRPMAQPNPRNYFVPNFGEDSDIKATKASASLAEKQLNHVWDP